MTNDKYSILPALGEQGIHYINSPEAYNSYDGLPYYHSYPNNDTIWTERIDKENPIYGTTY